MSTTAWTYNGTTYNPSTTSYNTFQALVTYLGWAGLTPTIEAQFAAYNAGGYKTFEQIFCAIGLGIWFIVFTVFVISWETLPEEWKLLLLNVNEFDPNKAFNI